MQDLINQLTPIIISLVTTIVGYYVTRATLEVRRRTGMEIESYHREALDAAIASGIRLALARLTDGPADVPTAELRQIALDYVQRSVPDAIAHLRATVDVLADKIEGRLSLAIDA